MERVSIISSHQVCWRRTSLFIFAHFSIKLVQNYSHQPPITYHLWTDHPALSFPQEMTLVCCKRQEKALPLLRLLKKKYFDIYKYYMTIMFKVFPGIHMVFLRNVKISFVALKIVLGYSFQVAERKKSCVCFGN